MSLGVLASGQRQIPTRERLGQVHALAVTTCVARPSYANVWNTSNRAMAGGETR